VAGGDDWGRHRLRHARGGYQRIQQTRPQTLGYGLTDSPAGQLAWNAELWTGWGDYADYLDVDTYLTHVSIYGYTRTGVSSARHYDEDARSGAGYRDLPNQTPTAVAVFPQDFRTVRVFAERANSIVRYTQFDRGGHFTRPLRLHHRPGSGGRGPTRILHRPRMTLGRAPPLRADHQMPWTCSPMIAAGMRMSWDIPCLCPETGHPAAAVDQHRCPALRFEGPGIGA
jgi:hypothetical protein